MGNFWAKSLGAGGQCEKWAGGGQEEQEEEKEEEVSTWAATTCSPVAGGRAGTLPPGANSRIPKPRPAPPLHSAPLCCNAGSAQKSCTKLTLEMSITIVAV